MSSVKIPHLAKHTQIISKYGNTLIGTLRQTYGTSFAPHCADGEKLGAVLDKLDVASLCSVVRDHDAGKLKQYALPMRRTRTSGQAN
jgi:hypothetical protein